MARTHLLGRREHLRVVTVILLDVAGRHDDARLECVGVREQVANLALLAGAVLLLVLLEIRRQVRVRQRDLVAERVGREDDELEFGLLVAAAVLALHIGIGDRDPVGDGVSQLLDEQCAAQVLLELTGRERRPLHLQHLAVDLLSGKLTVLLEGRDRVNAVRDFLVGHPESQPIGLGRRGPLVDELLKDLLVDPHLLQELLVQARTIRALVRLQLRLVGTAERIHRDLLAAHRRHRVVRRRRVRARPEEARDIKHDERQHHEREAPLEPALVAAHPVEHCHD